MFKKLLLIFACLFLIFICTSAVSADDLDNETAASLDDLSADINLTAENQTLVLDKDYKSTNMSQKHIIIDKSMTIDGANHTIEAPDCSRVFWVQADNVCIKNINFINSNNASLAGGVISWWGNNGTLTDCSFTNNSAISAGSAISSG